jgi:hypothetical protein
MTIAPHHDFRRLWIEAATPGDTMRALCCLERAWSVLTDSIADLPLLSSEELFEPLIELDQFQLPINEVLQRIVADQAFSAETEQVRPRPSGFPSRVETEQRKLNPSSPSESPASRRPSTFSMASSMATEELSPGVTAKQKAAAVDLVKGGAADLTRSRDSDLEIDGKTFPSRVDDPVQPRMRDHDAASGHSTVPHFAATSQQQLREKSALERLTSEETTTRRGAAHEITALTLPGQVKPVTAAEQPVKKSPLASAFRAEEMTQAGFATTASSLASRPERQGQRDSTTRRHDVFERVLGPAIERLSEGNRRRPQFAGPSIDRTSDDDLTLVDHHRRWRHARSSALQRLATRASADAIRSDEPSPSSVHDEFVSFTRANCVGASETDQFALQLSSLLRREMRYHGIDLAALEQ